MPKNIIFELLISELLKQVTDHRFNILYSLNEFISPAANTVHQMRKIAGPEIATYCDLMSHIVCKYQLHYYDLTPIRQDIKPDT